VFHTLTACLEERGDIRYVLNAHMCVLHV